MRSKATELAVGVFIIVGLLGLVLLAFKMSGLTHMNNGSYYTLNAEFDNIGGLKVRAAVRVSGVVVGRVTSIHVDPKSFRATVSMQIKNRMNNFPDDTSASILTQGLLGSNYIGLTPGFDTKTLKPGGMIETTHSALILENLIGQLMFNLKSKK